MTIIQVTKEGLSGGEYYHYKIVSVYGTVSFKGTTYKEDVYGVTLDTKLGTLSWHQPPQLITIVEPTDDFFGLHKQVESPRRVISLKFIDRFISSEFQIIDGLVYVNDEMIKNLED